MAQTAFFKAILKFPVNLYLNHFSKSRNYFESENTSTFSRLACIRNWVKFFFIYRDVKEEKMVKLPVIKKVVSDPLEKPMSKTLAKTETIVQGLLKQADLINYVSAMCKSCCCCCCCYPTPSEGWVHGGRPWSPRSRATPQGLN